MGFTEIEQEAIVLSAMIGMVDDMVNHSIWCIPGEKLEKTNLLPQTSTTLRLFGTLLRDLLSPLSVLRETKGLPFDLPKLPDPSAATDRTSLLYLKRIYENPLIGNDTTYLSLFVNEFAVWLEQYAVVEKLWLSRISIEVDLKIKRIDFIQICGDIGKHSFLRLGARTKTLQRILIENNVQISANGRWV
jgi:hypothetical protein